jgi:hypothetical protein
MSSFRDSAAAAFESANLELLRFIESCSDDDWDTICPGEGWPVAVVAYHCAVGHGVSSRILRILTAGHAVPGTPEMHHAANEAMAREHPEPTRDEVAALARRRAETTARLLRGLRDDQLDLEAPIGLAGGTVMSVRAWTERTSGHVRNHLASMRAAIDSRRAAVTTQPPSRS